jgi:hypothetical protein
LERQLTFNFVKDDARWSIVLFSIQEGGDMFASLGLSNTVLVVSAVVAGFILGGLCVEALRRSGNLLPRVPQWNLIAYGGGMLLGGGLLGGCMMLFGGGVPPVAPVDPCIGLIGTPPQGGIGINACPTQTATQAGQGIPVTDPPKILTLTPSVPPPLTRTPDTPPTLRIPVTPTVTSTWTPVPSLLPSSFNITLFATGETVCKAKDFNAPYRVTIQGTAMSLLQVNANITTTGIYAPTTGAFTTTKAGLPGLETYTGLIRFSGTRIQMSGTYTYTNDPNLPCKFGPWNIFGETTVP